MELPARRWFDASLIRRSRRKFEPGLIPANIYERLQKSCADFRPFPGARVSLSSEHPDDVFKGALGPYGKVKGASSFLVFIGKKEDPFINEKIGYTGEGIILEATALGMATCWVAGFFRENAANVIASIAQDERVFAVSPVGFAPEPLSFEEKIMTGFGRTHKRKPLSELISGAALREDFWPALKCARIAPSAVNRQPWRFRIDDNSVTVSIRGSGLDFGISKRLDCGITMLHLEVGLRCQGLRGRWEFLRNHDVARFLIDG